VRVWVSDRSELLLGLPGPELEPDQLAVSVP
jgi:hypothetical protein